MRCNSPSPSRVTQQRQSGSHHQDGEWQAPATATDCGKVDNAQDNEYSDETNERKREGNKQRVRPVPSGRLGSAVGPRRYVRSVKVATIASVTLLSIVGIFQIALAFGAPLGKAAWGGRHEGVLPKRLRIASGVAGLVYPLIIVAVLDVGFFDRDLLPVNGVSVMWILSALFAAGALANLASRSPIERLWAPVSLAISGCCAFVASSL
jgi:hypothetical protein